MILILILVAIGGAITGLVQLWRQRNPRTIALSGTALVLLGVSAFTAEAWYSWFGYSRGDGQVFIGYFLIGGFALAAAALAFVATLIVLAVRPRKIGDQA